MYFRSTGRAIAKLHCRGTLQLSPASAAELRNQTFPFADRWTAGNRLNVLNLANNFQVHSTVASVAGPGSVCRANGLTMSRAEPRVLCAARES